MAKYEWLYGNWFPCPPRGPCLERIHWYRDGLGLCAIDYESEIEDEPGHDEYEFHVEFNCAEAVLCTDFDLSAIAPWWEEAVDHPPHSGILKLNESPWMAQFMEPRSPGYAHFHLGFYDQIVDVICKSVEAHRGFYPGHDPKGEGVPGLGRG